MAFGDYTNNSEHGHSLTRKVTDDKNGFLSQLLQHFLLLLPRPMPSLLSRQKKMRTLVLYLGSQIWQSGPSGIFGEENTLVDFNLTKEQQINYLIDV